MNEAERKLAQATARAEGSRVAYEWMKRNLHRYAACDANSKLIGDWLKENNLDFTEDNLDRAAEALDGQLAEPQAATPAPPQEPTLDEVAPVPLYMKHIRTKADIAKISSERAKELRRGPHGEAFKKRVDAIMQGVKPAPRPTTVVSQVASTPVDDGLPPVPEGLDWPSTVAEVKRMSREDFRHLYHSKVYGEAFRSRVDEIYRRAGARR